jgi:hypothetical protein
MLQSRWCKGKTKTGKPCMKYEELIGEDGYCTNHRPGNENYMSEIRTKGAYALHEANRAPGIDPGDLPEMVDLDSAQKAINVINRAMNDGRITHHTGNAMLKGADIYCKSVGLSMTSQVVNELHAELKQREREIADLRKQLAGRPALRAVK